MDFGGRYILSANRAQVWTALNDAAVLKATIPGCNRINWVGPAALEVEIKVNFGIVSPVFVGDLSLSDVVPAERYTLNGRGRGGLLGLAHGAADITLSDHADGTELSFAAKGRASGQVMRLGQAILGSSAQRVIDGFFERFADAMGSTIRALPADPA